MLKRLLNRFRRRKKTKTDRAEDDFNKIFADVDTMRQIYKEEATKCDTWYIVE